MASEDILSTKINTVLTKIYSKLSTSLQNVNGVYLEYVPDVFQYPIVIIRHLQTLPSGYLPAKTSATLEEHHISIAVYSNDSSATIALGIGAQIINLLDEQNLDASMIQLTRYYTQLIRDDTEWIYTLRYKVVTY